MDQDQFDHQLIDYLFDELDEESTDSMRRKLDEDPECREVTAGLRAALKMSELPLEEPSVDLEERILEAADRAETPVPWHTKLVRALAWAGSHAMRPQVAMAAILMLVLGSSILLLRARPGTIATDPKAASKAASKTTAAENTNAAQAALQQANSVRTQSGCVEAIPSYRSIQQTFPDTRTANDAAWEQADCHHLQGEHQQAQKLWRMLQSVPEYQKRAKRKLDATR